VRGVLAVVSDITVQARAMEKIMHARSEAQQANRAKDELLAVLGHELRNPLEMVAPLTLAMAFAAPEVPAPASAPPSKETKAQGQRILVVDDNPDVADLLGELLEMMGHTVRIAHDGPEALEAAPPFAPTLVLVDIGLPMMDGYEVARRLRERGVTAPLVAITGYGQARDRERAREAGFAEHLVKPVRPELLERVIHDLAP